MSIIDSASASAVPGDTLRVMTRPCRDSTGRWWPTGTTYQPLSVGIYGQTVTIQGQRVHFALPAKQRPDSTTK